MTDSLCSPAALPEFEPVPRDTVSRGWTPDKQLSFIEGLAATGSVRMACEGCGMSLGGVYKLRNAPGAGSFARAWDIAVGMGAARIRDVLFDHAIHGVPETVIVGKTTRIERRRFNHRTMIWALQHHMPDQYPGGPKLAKKLKPWQQPADPEKARADILKMVAAVRAQNMIAIALDPAKRAAFQVLNPEEHYDWDELAERGRREGRAGT